MYEFFYTKASLVYQQFWPLCKYLCFMLTATALGLFATVEKNGFQTIDVKVTYALLYGALLLDIMSFPIHIFTDFTATLTINSAIDSYGSSALQRSRLRFVKFFNKEILARLLWLWRPRWSELKEGPYKGFHQLSTCFPFRRWSRSISGHNFVNYCLDQSVAGVCNDGERCCTFGLSVKAFVHKVVKKCGGGNLLLRWKYKSKNPFFSELWECIFYSLVEKSEHALTKKSYDVSDDDDQETFEYIYSARGKWALRNEDIDTAIRQRLKSLVESEQIALDERLLLWHIATTLCYVQDAENEGVGMKEREISKILSDYMGYLLLMQPNLVSTVAGIVRLRIEDTYEGAKRFFSERNILKHHSRDEDEEEILREACSLLFQVPTEVPPREVKGDRSRSVLFDACRLAKVLNNLEGNKKWEFIRSVWVELLSYTASHCKPVAHVQLLNKGGELVSFVWLLMAHLGLSTQFRDLVDAETRLV